MANGLLITMPNKQAHAALSILKQSRILAPDVTEVGAIKHVRENTMLAGHVRGSVLRERERERNSNRPFSQPGL